ncbi:MAG: DUF5667 domain-containing protein [Candidatus Levyibacteriota bacterium]
MLKKIGIFIFILLALGMFSKTVLAQEDSTATPSPVQKVEYDLPYPGLLPDNPLYFLKSARDKLIEILISSPQKKAEFFLLSSDKRVNTGYYLVQKGKNDLGVLYISKSNNYMHMAILAAKDAGAPGKDLLSKMLTSIKKHEEIIQTVEQKVDKKNRTDLQNEFKRLEDFTSLIKE